MLGVKYNRFVRVCTVFIGLLIVSISSQLNAQNEDYPVNNRITDLSISGLKRTRLSTAERSLQKFIGYDADHLEQNDVWAAIINTGILEPVSVEIQDADIDGKMLVVEVREKWSIFPIPVVMAGSGGVSAGGAVFDANAFGLNDKFFFAGLYLQGGWTAVTGYFHASSGGQMPGWNGMVMFSQEKREDVNQSNQVLRRFEQDSITLMAGLSLKPLQNFSLLSVSPRIFFNDKNLKNSGEALNGPLEPVRLFGTGLRFSLNRNSWDGYFLSQEETSIQYTYRITTNSYSFHSLNIHGIWEKSLIPGFRLVTRAGFVYDPDAPIFFESSPSDAHVDILPRSFSARNYAGLSAGMEKYLFKISAGTLSIAAAYQMVYSQGSVLEDSLDHGFAGKLSFYLSRLAIPAVGLGVSYNAKEQYTQVFFSMGMSF